MRKFLVVNNGPSVCRLSLSIKMLKLNTSKINQLDDFGQLSVVFNKEGQVNTFVSQRDPDGKVNGTPNPVFLS